MVPKKNDRDDDEEENDEDAESPFDFFNMFESDLFKSKEFQKIFKDVYKKISEFLPQFQNLNPEEVQKWFMKNKGKFFQGNPFVAGFNINFRPDGTPIVERFGNVKPATAAGAEDEVEQGDLREPLVDISDEPGQLIDVGIFKDAATIDVTGKSKGKGFQGVMKRHGFHGGKASHGVNKVHRAGGSIGMAAWPARVLKGTKMAGRMGNRNTHVKNLEVVEVDTENNLLLVKGAVPGSRNTILRLTTPASQG